MSNQKGFSFIELLSVIILIVIGVIIAIPSYQFLIEKYHAMVVVNNLVNAITFAKVSAIRYQQTVTLCASHSGKFCEDDFTQGMMVFIDKEGKRELDKVENLLRVYPKISAGQLVWNRKEHYLQFAKTGFLQSNNGTFFYYSADPGKKYSQKIFVSTTGRVRCEN